LLSTWTIVIGAPLLVLLLDQAQFVPFVTFAVKAFAGTLPYIAFAVALIAWLKAAGAEAYVGKAFEGRETQAIVLAALFGGLAPFCSCEVIPFIAGLLAVGAPLSAIMAFWLSSPLIDPPTLLITAGALGWSFAIGKAVFAVALGLFGGFLVAICFMRSGPFPTRSGPAPPPAAAAAGPRRRPGAPSGDSGKTGPKGKIRRRAQGQCAVPRQVAGARLCARSVAGHLCSSRLIAGLVGGEGVGTDRHFGAGRHAGLSQQLRRAAAARGSDGPGHERRRGDGLHDRRCCQLDPGHGGGLVAGQAAVFATYLGLGFTGAVLSGLLFQMIV
jgi:hypothetical protein